MTMDFDGLLTLEEQYYQDGYREGQNENLKQNFLEGKQFWPTSRIPEIHHPRANERIVCVWFV